MKFEKIKLTKGFGVYALTTYKPLKFIDYILKTFPKVSKHLGNLCIALSLISAAFLLTLLVSINLHAFEVVRLNEIYEQTTTEQIITAGLVLPINLSSGNQGVVPETLNKASKYIYYVPFLTFILVIAISVIPHELGHYFFMRKNKLKVKRVGFGLPSFLFIPLPILIAFVDQKKDLNKCLDKEKIEIASGGPGMNILLFLLFLPLYVYFQTQFLWYCLIINLALGTFNALPLGPLDGGYIYNPILKSQGVRIMSYFILGLIILPMLIT